MGKAKIGYNEREVQFSGYFVDSTNNEEKWQILPLKKKKSATVSKSYVQQYRDCISLLNGLTPCATNLINWICSVMDDDNIIRSDQFSRAKFIEYWDGFGVSYDDQTVKIAFGELIEHGITRREQTAVHRVNPIYYWKGKIDDRYEAIKVELEFGEKKEAQILVSTKTGKTVKDVEKEIKKRVREIKMNDFSDKQIKKLTKGKKKPKIKKVEPKIEDGKIISKPLY